MTEVNGDMPAGINNSGGILERIKQLEKEQLESGEVINTPGVTFRFPFLRDDSYLGSPNKDVLMSLAGPQNTVHHVQEVMRDLGIKKPVIITRMIPVGDKKWMIIPSLGIGGRALSDAEIELYFDPNHANIVESLSSWSGRQIAHELNHVARWQAHAMGKTLLDAMIGEGLATHYEEHWKGTYEETKWGHALNQGQLKEEWTRAQKELGLSAYNYKDWFFGIDKGHPLYTGYSLGTAIVGEYLKNHPRERMAKVVKMPSKNILEKSGYSI